jgi:hypothetical protein
MEVAVCGQVMPRCYRPDRAPLCNVNCFEMRACASTSARGGQGWMTYEEASDQSTIK